MWYQPKPNIFQQMLLQAITIPTSELFWHLHHKQSRDLPPSLQEKAEEGKLNLSISHTGSTNEANITQCNDKEDVHTY